MHTSTSSGKFRYPGVKPFTPEEQDLFFGREKDIADLFTLIFVRQIVVLYGKSGYGKSSLINAGIIPKLQAETKFKPFTIRFTNYIDKENTPSPTDTVRGRLSAELPDQSSPLDQLLVREDSFWYLIKTRQWLQETSQVVLIFDQFEELFSYPKEQIKAFSEQLSQLLYTTIPVQFRKPLNELDERGELSDDFHEFLYQKPDVKVVFSVRSDRLSLLNMLTAQHPTILQHCYELDALSPHEARKAIIQPARLPKELGFGSPRFSYSKEVLEAILKGVANPQDGKIETATLQIICRYVEETLAKDQADSEVTREMLGDITDIFRQYYEGVLNRLPPEDRQKAQRLIEEKLITGNQRNALSEAFIKKEFDIDDKLLKTLETSSLLRKERDASGRLLYEVSHDTLVEPVQKVAELRLKKEEEEEKAELERQIQKEKDRVRERDEALKEKQKLIDAFYFHEDKFALAINSFSSISNSLKDKKFYFIDKEGNEWTHLGRWDKAEQFDEDSGFAKVSIKNEDRLSSFNSTGKPEENDSDNSKKGNDFGTSKFEYNNKKNEGGEEGDNNNSVKPEEKGSVKQKKESIKSKERSYRDYLLDVHGNSYRVCYELSDLDKEITAVDLRGKHFSEIFPSKILEYPQLQILIIDGQNDKKNRFNAIPPGLAKLKNLIYLSFQFCEINKFPDVLGGLKKLQKLLLGNNQLEFIPEALCELTELTELSLSSNQLKEIPESISNLSKLQKLYLDKNQLELLPEALYKLRELNELHLTENKLNEISGKIANLKELEILSLSGNKLAKLPNSFWELREIRQIGLWGNQLSEISESIGNLSKLQKLYLEQNPLESIPEALYELTELTELSLSSTQLKEIPESIGNLSKLQVLSLSENQLKSIPEGFYKLRELKEVYLWSNQLSEISESIGNLSKLQKLYLEQNQLESIPESLYELQELTELYLWSNQLKEISESIGKLSKLRTLSFDQNQLESIPEALCELYQLTELGLSGNKIKAIPIHIDNCLKLQILNLNTNQLESLPDALYDLKNLTELYLKENQLSWIKESIAKLVKLKILGLGGNKLSSLPDSFWGLSELTELYLWNNQLREISGSIGNLSKLQKLDLNTNQLESLPDALYDLKNLTELYLKENQLSWIKESIAKLVKLKILGLGGNKLSSLPDSFWGLSELTELYLWNNQLREISGSIGNLSKLQKLDLNTNQLESLPDALYDLGDLTELYVEGNKLSWTEALIIWGKRLLLGLDHFPKARIALENVIKQLQAEAQEKLNGEKALEAIGLFQQALRFERELSRPDNFVALNRQLVNALLKEDRLEEALAQLTTTIAIESIAQKEKLKAELQSLLTMVYFLLEDISSAQKYYQNSINLLQSQNTPSPGKTIGETWYPLVPSSRQFWTLQDGLRSLETSSDINHDSLTTLADTRNTLTGSLDKLYSLDTSNNESTIPIVIPVVLEVGNDIVPKVDSKADGGKFLYEDIPSMRERIEKDTGVKVPGVRARGMGSTENSGQFIIQLDEVPVFRGSVKVGKGYCPALYEVILLGVPIEATATNPWTGEKGCWVSFDYQDKLREANLELWEETLFIIYQIEVILRRNLANFLGIYEVETILKNHANTPGGEQQIATALADRPSRLHFARLLRTLVKENIMITNIGEILQTAQELHINRGNIDEIVRQVRLRNKAVLPGNQPGVQRFELPGNWEEMLNGWVSILSGKTKFTPPPDEAHELIQEIAWLVPSPNRNSVLVVQNYQIRPFLRRLLENRYPDLMVMVAEELDKTAVSDNKSKD